MAENNGADGFAPLRIKRVVRETSDAVSLVLDVPEHCSAQYRYQAGQFLTLRVTVDGQDLRRCYSMSSAPRRRRPADHRQARPRRRWCRTGSTTRSPKASRSTPPRPRGGSVCVTPPTKSWRSRAAAASRRSCRWCVRRLANSSRRIRLFYANRSRDSVIFADALSPVGGRARRPAGGRAPHRRRQRRGDALGGRVLRRRSPARPTSTSAAPARSWTPWRTRCSGPASRANVSTSNASRWNRFLPTSPRRPEQTEEVVIELDRKTTTADYRAGNTLLQTARIAGLRAPSSCETGSCGTCMARIVSGSARMLNNDALDDDEVAEGWVLTCQSLPTSRSVHVVYE